MAFDGETVLDSINLYINNKEFLTLVRTLGMRQDDHAENYRRVS